MKAFFLQYKKLHLWLLADLALLGLFLALRPFREIMVPIADAMAALRRGLGRLSALTRVSIMEVLCVLLVLLAVGYVLWSAAYLLRGKGERRQRGYCVLLGAGCAGLLVYAGFCWFWGVTYYVPNFQERSGIYARDVALDDLERVTRYFADRLCDTAPLVERDGNGLFSVPREEILVNSVRAYDAVSETFPFLAFDDTPPKAIHFSGIMSRLDFTGVYCPFTGESNVNVASPACLLPSTVAHELAHQRGVASEQECNFLAVLASTTCGLDEYAYSGWLLGYIYLGNALYSADPARWESVYASLPETVRADMADNNAYWAQFRESAVRKTSNQVYDKFLKSYGQEKGIQTYGTVVDMLVAYYAPIS